MWAQPLQENRLDMGRELISHTQKKKKCITFKLDNPILSQGYPLPCRFSNV